MQARVVEHGSPTRRRRGNAQAEKRKCRLGQDDSGHADGGLHKDRLDNIRQNVPEEDAQSACAQGAGRVDVFAVADGHHLRTNQASVAGPAADCQGQYKIGEARAKKGCEGYGKQNPGEGEEGVHGKGGESDVDPTAEVASHAANGEAQRQ